MSDFRKLNQRIKIKAFPITKIKYMLLNLEGFTHTSSIYPNMIYYRILLSPGEKKLCRILLTWGKYKYQKLPLGVCNSPDIFQEKISKLFEGFNTVCADIIDVPLITKKPLHMI